MIGGKIGVSMTLDTRDYAENAQKAGKVTNELRQTIESTAKSTKSLETHFGSFFHKFHEGVMTIGMAKFALADLHSIFLSFPTAVVKTTAEFERMSKMLEGLSGSAKTAKSDMSYIFNMAQKSPVEVKALTDTFVKFRSVGLDPTTGSVKALVDGISRFGGGTEQIKHASIAIQQMVGKGVISMEELRQQLGEAMPTAMQAMATGLNMTMSQLSVAIKRGTLESRDALDRMFVVMGIQNYGAAEAMMNTWSGMFEKLKTKWELFKNEVGQGGAFDGAKEQLGLLIDSFNSSSGKNVAFALGEGLSDALKWVVQIKDGIVEWGDKLLLIGEIIAGKMLFSAAVNSVKSVTAAVNSQYTAVARTAELQNKSVIEQNEALAKKKAAILSQVRAEMEGNEAVIAADAKNREEKKKTAAAYVNSAVAANRAEIRANMEKLIALRAQEEAYQAEKYAAEEARDKARQQKKSQQTAKQAIQQAQDEISAIQTSTEKIRKHNDMLNQSITKLNERKTAIKDQTVTLGSHSQQLISSNQALKAQAGELTGVIAQTAKATAAITTMTTAQKVSQYATIAMKDVWFAMGGWVGVAVAAIGALTIAFMNHKSATEQAREAEKRFWDAKRGYSSDDSIKANGKEIDDNAKSIKLQENNIRNLQNRLGMEKTNGSKSSIAAVQAELDQAIALINTTRSKSEQLRAEQKQHELNVQNDAISVRAEVAERSFAAIKGAKVRELEAREQARKDDWADRKKAAANDKVLSKKLEAEKLVDDNDALKKKTAALIQFHKESEEAYQNELNKLKRFGPREKDKNGNNVFTKGTQADIAATQKQIEKVQASRRELEEAARNVDGFANPHRTVDNKEQGAYSKEAKNPWASYVANEAADVAKAKTDQDAMLKEVDSMEKKRREKLVEILKKAQTGSFDSDVKDGKKVVGKNYFGDKTARADWVKDYTDQLAAGTLDVAKFVASLEGLTEAEKKQVAVIVEGAAIEERQKLQLQAKTKATELAADAAAQLEDAQNKLDSSGASGATLLDKMTAKFEKLARETKYAGEELEEFNRERDQALADASEADYMNYIAVGKKAGDKTVTATTEYGRAGQEYDAGKAAIEAQHRIALAQAESDQLEGIEKSRQQQIAALNQNYNDKTKSGMIKLAENWQDVTANMNKMTANWASSFVDAVADFTTTGKLEWKSMLLDWAKQLNKVMIQSAAGNLIQSAGLGSLGDKLGAMMGGSQKSAGAAATAESPVAGIASSLGGWVSSLFGGNGDGAETTAGGLPIDKATNAVRVTMTTAGALDQTASIKDMLFGEKKGDKKDAAEESAFKKVQEKSSDLWNGMTEKLSSFGDSVGSTFSSLSDSVGSTLGGIFDSLGSSLSSMFSGSSGGGAGSWLQMGASMAASFFRDGASFANGGVMSQFGSVELRKYANGGVANSPQLALYGEGSMNEAYVPLPDGRSIPVTMTGGATTGGGTVNQVSIQINVEQSGEATQETQGSDPKQVWKSMSDQVRIVVLDELTKHQRPGGALYR